MKPNSITSVQHSTDVPAKAIGEEEMKATRGGKEDVKLTSLACDMILNVESCKDSTKALLKFGKFAGYKISTPKSAAFLYSDSEQSKRKLTIPFMIASKKIKCLGINKEVEASCTENYRMLLREINKDISRETSCVHVLED